LERNAVISNFQLYTVKPETRSTAIDAFGTICLPYTFTAFGADVYEVSGIENNVVKLTKVDEAKPGVAYIYQATAEAQTFTIADGDAIAEPTTAEYLNGVFTKTTATADTYVLQTQDGVQAFYKVAEGSEPTIGAFRAYLTVPSTEETTEESAAAIRISLNGEVTGIDAVNALTNGNATIYDLNGRKLNKLQKGINIVNGVKVIVK
jgi:hypothetical protein